MSGVLPYTYQNCNCYVLLAKDPEGWCPFYDGIHKKEKTPKDTASRIAYEQLCGLLGSRKSIKNRLKPLNPRSHDSTFVLRVDNCALKTLNSSSLYESQEKSKFKKNKHRATCKIPAKLIFELFCRNLPCVTNSHTPKSRGFVTHGKDR
jgi:hypothetical protein